MLKLIVLSSIFLFSSISAFAAKNVPHPQTCTPEVNRGLENLVNSGTRRDVDNVMVCGTAVGKTRLQKGGPHGSHQVITLAVALPSGRGIHVQVVINDALDGVVTADDGDQVSAYGQGYLTSGAAQAGVHDVHCSTHTGADNGWVYINNKLESKVCQ